MDLESILRNGLNCKELLIFCEATTCNSCYRRNISPLYGYSCTPCNSIVQMQLQKHSLPYSERRGY
jgi:hypothetical protein